MEKCFIRSTSTTTKEWHMYIHGEIENFEDYDDLIKDMCAVGKNDKVTVYLNTPGGTCAVGFHIIDHIRAMPCPVHIKVTYPTYSMGAIMALCGTKLTIEPDAYIMFHDYSGGAGGKGNDVHLYTTNYRKVFKDRFKRLCCPFLTRADTDRMFKGEDIYIHHDDPTLKQRIERHFKACRLNA